MGNCYRVPSRSSGRKSTASKYHQSGAQEKFDGNSSGVSNVTHGNAVGVNSRQQISSTSLQHISEREPEGIVLISVHCVL
jgi:hypothetical protein